MANRLFLTLRERIRRGEISERGLARLTGYSQPHIHNILHGKRGVTLELLDEIMTRLGIPLLSLVTQEELGGRGPSRAAGALPVPLLHGYLGGGHPYPGRESADHLFFPPAILATCLSPVAARVDREEWGMWPHVHPGDYVLLDRSPAARHNPDYSHVHVVVWRKRAYLAHCRRTGQALVLGVERDSERGALPEKISLRQREILDIVRGRLIWLGRDLTAVSGPLREHR